MHRHSAALICLLGATLLCANNVRAERPDQTRITGLWVTQGYGAQVVIAPCSDFHDALCGQIAWLWTDKDTKGQPLKDIQNPVEQLRNRSLVGTPIFRNFTKEADGRWRGDGIYNPEDGNTYSASLGQRSDGTLEVTGCVLGIFCQTQIWRRPQSVCPGPHLTPGTLTLTQQD